MRLPGVSDDSECCDLAKHISHPCLKLLDSRLEVIEFIEQRLCRIPRLQRKLPQALIENPPPSYAKQIRGPIRLQSVLRQVGMDAILQFRSLSDEDHPCPR